VASRARIISLSSNLFLTKKPKAKYKVMAIMVPTRTLLTGPILFSDGSGPLGGICIFCLRSDWQCLHKMASAMMTSAQYGQLFFPASTDETPFSKQKFYHWA
jgi:hypothetical protein